MLFKQAIAQTNCKTPDDTSDNSKLPKDKDDTCTTAVDKETAATPPCTPVPQQQDNTSNSEGEYTDVYEADEEYDRPPYASQPMITGKHGASYTPPGWKRELSRQNFISLQVSTPNLRSQMIVVAAIMSGEHLLMVYKSNKQLQPLTVRF